MREVLDDYSSAILVRFASREASSKAMPKLERAAFLAGYYKAFVLGAGYCGLCKECSVAGCKNPKHARPSMEACGIDVFHTVRELGLAIEVVADRTGAADYFATLLLE